jgi:hypothetical protein
MKNWKKYLSYLLVFYVGWLLGHIEIVVTIN